MHRGFATTTPHTTLPKTYRTNTALPDRDGNEVGSASLINNWLCDTCALAHITPIFLDIEHEDEHSLVDKQHSVHIEVADNHLVDVPTHVEALLNQIDTDGIHLQSDSRMFFMYHSLHRNSYLSVNWDRMTTHLR
jgi:hypothetical protein